MYSVVLEFYSGEVLLIIVCMQRLYCTMMSVLIVHLTAFIADHSRTAVSMDFAVLFRWLFGLQYCLFLFTVHWLLLFFSVTFGYCRVS